MRRSLTVAMMSVAVAACSRTDAVDTYTDAAFDTYPESGVVWIVSDCPQADHALAGGTGDGLPMKGQTDRERVEALARGYGDDAEVVPRNGEVWDRTANGSVVLERVDDFMLVITIDDASDCPDAPIVLNGIPVVYEVNTV